MGSLSVSTTPTAGFCSTTSNRRTCTAAAAVAAARQAFCAGICGGILCAIGQILIDKTPLTPARILTGYVVCGVLLTAIGVYEPIVEWGGAGATVPLLGFGYSLAKGVEKAVQEQGWLGVMTGGLSATAGGIAAAVVFAVLMALIFKPGDKR